VIFHCCERRRLEVLRRSSTTKNAIEFLEVLDHAAPPGVEPQRTLFVRLLRAPPVLTPANVSITGGARIPTIGVEWVATADNLPATAEPGLVGGVDELPRTLVVRTTSNGDFSRYIFALIESPGSSQPPPNFDPLLSSIDFSFKVECPSDFDCAAPLACAPAPVDTPRIDYLAKDYAGFRRLMLDRLSLLTPSWTERSAADAGMALVELLAYAADNLSYRQDVVANEAYLNTARQRVSVRRHARLVDYFLHEGCNARALVHFELDSPGATHSLPANFRLFTQIPGVDAAVIITGSEQERAARNGGSLVFETVHAKELRESLNELDFYTWGDEECCLPRGATSATLVGHAEGLVRGDFLVFVERRSPTRLTEEDADRNHRHAVRLTRVEFTEDPSGKLFGPEGVDEPAPITRIEWDPSDALPFSLCISVAEEPRVSVALGNIVLVEHGEVQPVDDLPPVPGEKKFYARRAHQVGECCDPPEPLRLPLRYRPVLRDLPLSHGFRLAELLEPPADAPQDFWSAAALRALDPRDAMPQVLKLTGEVNDQQDDWFPRRDLLASDGATRDFVVEIQDDGRARLRFGDDTHGRRPEEETGFKAIYRIGNGAAGNVGAESIRHLLLAGAAPIGKASNPLPAFGGIDAEDIEAARRDAPQAFRTQERAVTAADYAEVAGRRTDVQRAAATFRWTGSWHTVFVTADRVGGAKVDAGFEDGLRRYLERFRMAGYDLEVDAPHFVPLDVSLHICVKPGYFRSAVIAAVRDALSSVMLPDGRLGAFHPDNFTFGQAVYSSRVVAAAQAVEGVESVRLDRFQRLVDPDPTTHENGVIPVGRLEVAQLENNPNYRDRGRLLVSAGGGQ
jgi:Baseplate J-like protein